MSADDDPTGSRLTAARRDVAALAAALPGAEVALVAFGARAEVELPPTTDREALASELDALRPEEPTAGAGSSLDRPVPLLAGVLGGADPAETGPPDDTRTRRVLVVLSDGEDTAPGPTGSWAPVADLADAALVLGYGTPSGGGMRLASGAPLVDPATGEPAVTRRDDDALGLLAEQVGGVYLPRTGAADPAVVGAQAARLRGEAYADLAPAEPGRQVAWVWGLLLLALLLPELRLGWRRWLEAGREGRLGRRSQAEARTEAEA